MKCFKQSDSQMWLVRRWGALGLVLALALLIVGPSMTNVEPAFAQTPQPQSPQTLDDQFSAVARQVPEFGGMFLSDNGPLQVYLTHVNWERIEAVQEAIVDVFGAEVIPEGGIQARQGEFGFSQLREWYTRMVGPVLRTPGVTLTDIDEANNRLEIGLKDGGAKAGVLRQLMGLNIPDKAVALVVTGPIVPLAQTLQSTIRPTQGGYEIQRPVGGGGYDACTLGFNATSGKTEGFVTASHCTQVPWGLDNANLSTADFYQNDSSMSNQFVGTESIDPPGFPCLPPYPAADTCRWSDSAFVTYAAGVVSGPGLLGRTTKITTNWLKPIITVDPGNPTFGIVAPPSKLFLVGLKLYKVGRTTGWSEGSISQTCVDFPWSP
jgi:hypothetical protein